MCVAVFHAQRGLAPRVFEYLFTEIDKAQDDNVSGGGLQRRWAELCPPATTC